MGVNPYIRPVAPRKPTTPFSVTFTHEETGATKVVPVAPEAIPFGDHGLEGSLLDIAMGAGVDIPHSCGGVCACSTCHVYVTDGLRTCSPATDDEEDQLDSAPALTSESRLSCQCVPDGTRDLHVLIPKWNRNQVQEGHH